MSFSQISISLSLMQLGLTVSMNNLPLHALSKLELSKLKSSKHHWYFKYLLILSGDINLHPGPVQYPCSVCAKPVRKRFIWCEKCGLWIPKKCNQFEKFHTSSLLMCRPCQVIPNDHLEDSWHQFPSQMISLRIEMFLPMNKQILIMVHQIQSIIGKFLINVVFIRFI